MLKQDGSQLPASALVSPQRSGLFLCEFERLAILLPVLPPRVNPLRFLCVNRVHHKLEAVITADGNGTIRSVNAAVTPLFGHTQQGIVGPFRLPLSVHIAFYGFERTVLSLCSLCCFSVLFRVGMRQVLTLCMQGGG